MKRIPTILFSLSAILLAVAIFIVGPSWFHFLEQKSHDNNFWEGLGSQLIGGLLAGGLTVLAGCIAFSAALRGNRQSRDIVAKNLLIKFIESTDELMQKLSKIRSALEKLKNGEAYNGSSIIAILDRKGKRSHDEITETAKFAITQFAEIEHFFDYFEKPLASLPFEAQEIFIDMEKAMANLFMNWIPHKPNFDEWGSYPDIFEGLKIILYPPTGGNQSLVDIAMDKANEAVINLVILRKKFYSRNDMLTRKFIDL